MSFWKDLALLKMLNAKTDEDFLEAGFLYAIEEEKEREIDQLNDDMSSDFEEDEFEKDDLFDEDDFEENDFDEDDEESDDDF